MRGWLSVDRSDIRFCRGSARSRPLGTSRHTAGGPSGRGAAARAPPRRRPGRGRSPPERRPSRPAAKQGYEWLILVAASLAVALVVRGFLIQAFYIPSESMVPTLVKNDRVLVNKLSYKLHDVHRGDIVVFKAPPGAATAQVKDLIKRVVGLPGRDDRGPERLDLHRREAARRALPAARRPLPGLPAGEGARPTSSTCWATTGRTPGTRRSSTPSTRAPSSAGPS